MFTQLIESTPVRTRRPLSLILAIMIHGVLIFILLLLPLLAPEALSAKLRQLTFLITPPPPPPAPAAVPSPSRQPVAKKVVQDNTIRVPQEIPSRIAIAIDELPPQLPVAYATGMIPGGIPGGARNGILNGMLGAPPNPLAPPAPPLPSHATHTIHPVRIGGVVQQASLIRQVRPQYPLLARQARIQGAVVLEAVISKEGTVINLKVISGHPWLIPAALNAVRHWKYRPTLLNNEPVEVVTNITVNFSLDG